MSPWTISMATGDRSGYLLDTHAFIWLANGDRRVPERVTERLASVDQGLWLSVASIWEMAIKRSLGKLASDDPLDALIEAQLDAMQLRVLDVGRAHAVAVEELPFHHRDPFDRLLVAQAAVEGLTLVSRDVALDAYPIERFW